MSTPMTLLVLAVAALVGADPVGTRSARPAKPVAPGPSVVPAIRLKPVSKIDLRIYLENTTDRTITYLSLVPRGQAGDGVWPLYVVLYKNGRPVKRRAPPSPDYPPAMTKEHVRTLSPGEKVVKDVSISYDYGELEPGSYELVAEYDIRAHSTPHTELGVTPMSFKRKVLYLEIEQPASN